MKYSKATNYALHTMLYFMAVPLGQTVGLKDLSDAQDLSPTYLSKILTKLVKAGIIESTPGINGGYKLTRDKADPSFLEVIHAIEGTASLFHCGFDHEHNGCLIQETMRNAEQHMEDYLKAQKLVDLADQFSNFKGFV